MICKDCLHYEACDRLADAKLGYGIMQVRTGVCKCFSDKSEWVHFPDKDCKTVYVPIGRGDKAQIIEWPIGGWGIKDGKLCIIDKYSYLYEPGVDMVFLTKEEAQKEVERRKNLV